MSKIREKMLFCIFSMLSFVIILIRPCLIFEIHKLVNWPVIFSLIVLMLISEGLKSSGFINLITIKFVNIVKDDHTRVIIFLIISSIIAFLLMNDTSLFIMIPLAITLSKITKIPRDKLVILTIIAVNVGSALTPIGNPQNLIIWHHYGIGFLEFLTAMLPFVIISEVLLITYAYFLLRQFRKTFKTVESSIPRIILDEPLCFISIILLIIFLVLGVQNSYILLPLAIIIFLILKKRILSAIDLELILIFILMFFDFNGLAIIISSFISVGYIKSESLFLISLLLSQLISNVPATVILINFTNDWHLLAIGVNLAGIGIVIGSMANIIGLKLANIDYKTYHKIAIPFFLLLCAIMYIALFI